MPINPKDACPTCGVKLQPGEAPHATVTRVVKPNHIFAGKKGGELVQVEHYQLTHGSVTKATISVEEAERAQMLQVQPPKPRNHDSVAMAQKFTQQAHADFQREKQRREHEARRTAEKATQAALDILDS